MHRCAECKLAFGDGRAYWMIRQGTGQKCIWLSGLIILLGIVYIWCRQEESSRFGGLGIVLREELEELTAGMQYIEKPLEVDGFLTLRGQNTAYDKKSHTFYVSQPVAEDELASVFDTPPDGIRIFVEEDELVRDVEEAMRLGHTFRVWMVGEQEYTILSLVLTGAPLISISSQDRLASSYREGEILLTDPEDEEVNGLSVRASCAFVKYNANSETYTVKLMKEGYAEEKKLSLLGIGKNNTWKLYKVSENDGSLIRAKLAAEVWNAINADTPLVRAYELVEVIENNSYKGLYLMAPKWTRSMLGLSGQDSVVKSEDPALEKSVWSDISSESAARYYLFLQAVYAYKNVTEDYAVIEKADRTGETEYIPVPDKLEYAFGGFQRRLQYLTWEGNGTKTSHMSIRLEDLCGVREERQEDILQICRAEWSRLRDAGLDNDSLRKKLEGYERYLTDSGLAKRCVAEDRFGYYYGLLEDYVADRMEYLDEFFGDAGGTE